MHGRTTEHGTYYRCMTCLHERGYVERTEQAPAEQGTRPAGRLLPSITTSAARHYEWDDAPDWLRYRVQAQYPYLRIYDGEIDE